MLALANEITVITILIHIVVVGVLGWQVYRHTSGNMRYSGFFILYTWLGATILIVTSGIVEDMTSVLSPLGIVMTTAIALGLGLIFYWVPLKNVIANLPVTWLMGVQIYRVVGIVFFIGWVNGEIPTMLGPITAFYDVSIGMSALVVIWLWMRQQTWRTLRIAQIWNILGILDFVYAITIGVLAAPHALQLLQLSPDSSALGVLPLSFIALWAVPLSILLHVISLIRLRQLSASIQ